MTRLLIVTAGDFGLHQAVNEAVEQASHGGIPTSASLMASGSAAADAVGRPRQLPNLRSCPAGPCTRRAGAKPYWSAAQDAERRADLSAVLREPCVLPMNQRSSATTHLPLDQLAALLSPRVCAAMLTSNVRRGGYCDVLRQVGRSHA
jgi:hypothetical protein